MKRTERVQEGCAPSDPGEGSAPGVEEPPARRYGVRPGNPGGVPEDPARCREEVWGARGFVTHQCQRPRGWGQDNAYCSIHGRSSAGIKPLDEERKRLRKNRNRA